MVCSGNPNMNKAEHKIMFFGKQTLFVDHHTTQNGHRAGVLPGLEQENSMILELHPREELQRGQNGDAPNAEKPQ